MDDEDVGIDHTDMYEARCPYCGKQNIITCKTYGVSECDVRCRNCGYIFVMELESTEDTHLPPEKKSKEIYQHKIVKHSDYKRYIIMGMLLTAFLLGIIYATTLFQISGLRRNLSSGEKGTIFGNIITENGTGICGAEICVDTTNTIAVSDDKGYFMIENVSAGEHKIHVFLNGNKIFSGDVYVDGGKTIYIEITYNSEGHGGYYSSDIKEPGLRIENMNTTLGYVVIISSIMCLIAFYCVMNSRYYYMAVVACFVGIFSFGFYIGMFMTISAFALIILSKEDFK